jgi:hypothetical protein
MARKKKIDNTLKQNLNNVVSDNTNICLQIENEHINIDSEINIINKPKSKRGRKSKKELLLLNNKIISNTNEFTNHDILQIEESNDENNILILNTEENQQVKSVAKKRGRKPKGGKIIQQVTTTVNVKETKSNVILHLKCHIKDLHNNLISNNVNGYDFMSNKNELYEVISNNENIFLNAKTINNATELNNDNIFSNIIPSINNVNYKIVQYDDEFINSNDEDNYKSNKNNDLKDLWKKLKNLQHNLHLNNINDKKSACFWCTYEFDNPPIYIPKHYIKDSYHVYGCFCSPECATAYLMEENIDSSTKFERYHLLNHIYSKIYDYKKNIKPAPKPFYMLEKFYGNLNIQEYRSLLKNERLFLVVDKPLTRILPELHEDNDDFIINNKIISSNTYQIKKKVLQKQSKNNILSEKFGLQQNS